MAADGFYLGPLQTAIAANEILTEIRIPTPPRGSGHSYQKLKRKVGDFATAATAVQLSLDGGTCRRIGIALTNLASTPLRLTEAEQLLTGKRIDDALIKQAMKLAIDICEPSADCRIRCCAAEAIPDSIGSPGMTRSASPPAAFGPPRPIGSRSSSPRGA